MKIDSTSTDRLTVTHRPWVVLTLSTILGLSPILGALLDTEIGSAMRAFLLALGGAMTWAVWRYMPMTTIIFDRPSGQVTLIHHRITGNTKTTYPLATVTGTMHQSRWSDGTRLERLALKTDHGPIPMEFGYSGGPRRPVVKEINDWLSTS